MVARIVAKLRWALSFYACGGGTAFHPRLGAVASPPSPAVLAISVVQAGAAFAGEGNGPRFPGNDVPNVAVSRTVLPSTPAYTSGVVIGNTLPSNSGSQGEPEPANSLPPGFEDGTPAMQHRQALHSYGGEGSQAQAG